MKSDLRAELPVFENQSSAAARTRKNSSRHYILHVGRTLLFCVIVLLIRTEYRKAQADILNDQFEGVTSVVNEKGDRIGVSVSTFPACNRFVGYSGSTNSEITLDSFGKITHVEIAWSGDTFEHVELVRDADNFLPSFIGLDWNRPEVWPEIDSVSGATLTSIATKNAIVDCAGGTLLSTKFSNENYFRTLEEVFKQTITTSESILGQLCEIHESGDSRQSKGKLLGYFFLTASICDDMNGYQGPTNAMVLMNPQKEVVQIIIESSYENLPYYGYLNDDEQFQAIYQGKKLAEIPEMKPEELELEGVSGATMTSQSVMTAIPHAAGYILSPPEKKEIAQDANRQRWVDAGTIAICLLGLLIAFTRLKGVNWFRKVFLWLVIGVLGFVNGDLLSVALVSGWSQLSIPYRAVPGLAFLTLAAFAVPIFSKRNIYCQHLCPFGAAQQLVVNRGPKIRLSRLTTKFLESVPVVLLFLAMMVSLFWLQFNLASIEPFNAFSFRAAGWATIVIAIVGFAVSIFVPMAYCRFGCPTGTVLSFLKFRGDSDRFSRRDFIAVCFLGFAILATCI